MFSLYKKNNNKLTFIAEDEDLKVLKEQAKYLINTGQEDNLVIKDSEGLVVYAEGSISQPNFIHDLTKITVEEYYGNNI